MQGQLVDGLNLISSGLRAGLSLPQSMGMVVEELPQPISQEFNLVLQQNRLGIPLDEALDNLNERLSLQDLQMFVSSVSILRETGGNLPETFDTISDVIRERVRLDQKIQTFVAQGKLQGGDSMCNAFCYGRDVFCIRSRGNGASLYLCHRGTDDGCITRASFAGWIFYE